MRLSNKFNLKSRLFKQMNQRLEYLVDCTIVQSLMDTHAMSKTAQDGGMMANLASGIKDYVMEHWDNNDKVDSILAFVGPGLLSLAGFGWLAFIYEVAEVLGFDFIGFFRSIRQGLGEFVGSLASGQEKPSEDQIYNKVKPIVEQSAQEHFNGSVNYSKMPDLMMKAPNFISDMKDAKEIGALDRTSFNKMIKNAGIVSTLIGKLTRLLIKIFSVVITTGIKSLGFAAIGGAASTALGLNKEQQEPAQAATYQIPPAAARYMSTIRAKSVPSDLTEVHPNTTQDIWMENLSIENIGETLANWAAEAYPDLAQYKGQLEESQGMQRMVAAFSARNRASKGLNILTIPRPFERKMDIVDQIVGEFISDNPNIHLA